MLQTCRAKWNQSKNIETKQRISSYRTEIVKAMIIYSGGVLIQFKIQLETTHPKLYSKFTWGQLVISLILKEHLPHLRQITTHLKYRNLDKKSIYLYPKIERKFPPHHMYNDVNISTT